MGAEYLGATVAILEVGVAEGVESDLTGVDVSVEGVLTVVTGSGVDARVLKVGAGGSGFVPGRTHGRGASAAGVDAVTDGVVLKPEGAVSGMGVGAEIGESVFLG